MEFKEDNNKLKFTEIKEEVKNVNQGVSKKKKKIIVVEEKKYVEE